MNSLWCAHLDVTPDDPDGRAFCVKCGALTSQRLTLPLLLNTFEAIRRDHGMAGRHSMRCVDTPEGWCCADDCTLTIRK